MGRRRRCPCRGPCRAGFATLKVIQHRLNGIQCVDDLYSFVVLAQRIQ
jgi:hypothetical protein